jgi:hypothetical protein
MEDHSTEALELQEIGDPEEYSFDQLLGDQELYLDEDIIPLLVNHVDCFVSQSRGNDSIQDLFMHPPYNGHDDDVWEKLGQAVGNLQTLQTLLISTRAYQGPIPGWDILAHILKYVRQRIKLYTNDVLAWDAEASRSFARVIHGHPSICSFDGGRGFSHETMDILYSALATLPALESIQLLNAGVQEWPEDISTLANAESLTALLRVPTLRSVNFKHFSFTPALFQATANALMEGTAITKLVFTACSVSVEASTAMMIKSLSRNTSVTCINVMSPCDVTLCNAM